MTQAIQYAHFNSTHIDTMAISECVLRVHEKQS